MKLVECSANKLNRLSQKKKLILFGAGDNMYHFLDVYKEYRFEEKIACIIDGSPDKIGKTIAYRGVSIDINAYDFLKKINLKEYTLVITALCYKEIFAQVQNISNDPKLRCYRAPRQRIQLWNMIRRIVCTLPLSNIIVLNGEGDTCENAQALGKYIAKKNYFGKYRLIWLCDHPEKFKNSKKEWYLNRRTEMYAQTISELLQFFFMIGRAKYIIFENQIIPKMRTDQIAIYLNHGSPPIKATKGIINLPKDLNWAISPSAFSTNIITEQYGINKARILCCGSPRTDCLFDLSDVEQIKREFELSGFEKVILWVPTFRQRKNSNRVDTAYVYHLGIPVIESQKDYEKLTDALEQNNVLLLMKPHLLQDIDYIKLVETSHFRILTNEKLDSQARNVYDLLKCADGMITDYSTIAFDYMLLDRPIGYTLDDMKEYRLGFSVDHIEDLMPGKHIFDIQDLIGYVKDIKEKKDFYAEKRHEVMRKARDYPDGNNAERLCKMLGWE